VLTSGRIARDPVYVYNHQDHKVILALGVLVSSNFIPPHPAPRTGF
jgi:hypothetical protein